jgi:two-component system response regulator
MPDHRVEILLVEDSVDEVAFFIRTLKVANLPARIHVASNGKEALDFIFGKAEDRTHGPAHYPRVIFLDLKLPLLDGLQVLRRLKSDPHTRAIPVVVLSSSQEERDLVESYQLGVNSYVVKPMDFQQFGKSVQLLGQYWLQLNQSPSP